MTKQADLNAYLFEGPLGQREEAGPLSATLLRWMDSSMRFTGFVEAYLNKIRKKMRVARDAESLFDVLGELEVAYCLLNDRRLEVQYEPYMSTGRRGADFAVTYRVNLAFNVEVARVREEEQARVEPRIIRILLDKLGQMQPGMPNLLVIHMRPGVAPTIDLAMLMQSVKTRVEAKDESLFAASRYTGPADFYKEFLRLSGLLIWGAEGQAWVNRQARPGLDEKVIRLVSDLSK